MSDLRKQIKEAYNTLMNLQPHIEQSCYSRHHVFIDSYVDKAMGILKEALDEPQQQEPVAFVNLQDCCGLTWHEDAVMPLDGEDLYTHPSNVRRLSDDEIRNIIEDYIDVEEHIGRMMANDIMDACNIPKEGE